MPIVNRSRLNFTRRLACFVQVELSRLLTPFGATAFQTLQCAMMRLRFIAMSFGSLAARMTSSQCFRQLATVY
jgi:3-deoxy-D-arabino-heptulosonate 7-phosphate (DAHP) synthase